MLRRSSTTSSAPHAFVVQASPSARAGELRLSVTGPAASSAREQTVAYDVRLDDQGAWMDLFADLARDFGLREPEGRRALALAPPDPRMEVLLDHSLSPRILYGYGDPAVMRVEEEGRPAFYLTCTSNDAPDAFPILRSADLRDWRLIGFAFPEGEAPAWAMTGAGRADFWAPEIHRVGERFWLCFTARAHDGELAIGLAMADGPAGPWRPAPGPLLGGGVIDSHLHVGDDGRPILFWKEDKNGVWPGLLASLLRADGALIGQLFPDEAGRRSASFAQAIEPWMDDLSPMQRFFALQNLIEAVSADFSACRVRIAGLHAAADGATRERLNEIADAMRTRIFAQPLTPEGELVGRPTVVLENDQAWEAHLIEGVWTQACDGRVYLFYAGNDFSTASYGLGCAVADHVLGPYRKHDGPLLRSTAAWWGPGHPSVARGPDGNLRLFLHAYAPGQVGYKAFRALLALRLSITPEGVAFA